MRLEDETLLSAYLDDELGPQDRQRVETALRSDPDLSSRFRELAEVREILSDLSRPGSAPDLTEAVLQRLSRRREARRSAKVLAIRSLLVAAAAVLAALTLAPWGPWARQDPGQPRIVDAPRAVAEPNKGLSKTKVAVREDLEALEASDTNSQEDDDRPTAPTLKDQAPQLADRPALDPEFLERERKQVEQRDFLRSLLERPEVLRVALEIPVGTDPEPILNVLDELMDQMVRKQPRYGRLQLGDGLLVDPQRPGEAIVYTLWADLPERKAILDQLQNRLGERVTLIEEPLHPELTTMLAEAGTLDVRPGTQGEIFEDPATEMQALLESGEGVPVPSPSGLRSFPEARQGPDRRGNDPAGQIPAPQKTGPSTVLIWVELPLTNLEEEE